MVSEQELGEMEERRAKAVKALDVGGIAGAFLCTTPLMEDMPRLIAEVRRLQGAFHWFPASNPPYSDDLYWCWCPDAPPQSHKMQIVQFKEGKWLTSWQPSHWTYRPEPPR